MNRCFVCSFSIWPTLLMRLFSFQVAPLLASMYQPSLSPLLFLPKQIHPHHGFWPIGILNLLGSTNQSASMYISLKLSAFVSSTNTSSSPISWDCRSRSSSCSPIGSYNFNESTIQNARRCLPHLDSVWSLSYYDNDHNDQTESWCGRQCHAFTIIITKSGTSQVYLLCVLLIKPLQIRALLLMFSAEMCWQIYLYCQIIVKNIGRYLDRV